MAEPVEFVVKKLPYDLSSHGGLALVGRLFKRINLPAMIDPQYPVRGGSVGAGASSLLTAAAPGFFSSSESTVMVRSRSTVEARAALCWFDVFSSILPLTGPVASVSRSL